MRKLFYCVVVLMMVLAIASCQENKQANIVFERVEGMMDDYPDSALAILDSMRKESESYPRSQKMRYELLCAKAQNKAYVDFTTDSVMKEVVEYYDAHGTANEKVEAHYLLGCVYRDLHESPAALNCYYDAVECADTLNNNCDYRMLMRVYGQMANELNIQAMPYKEIEAIKQYTKYAHILNDSLNIIRGIELESNAYYILGQYDSVKSRLDKARYLYEKIGYSELSARTLAPLVLICLKNNKIAEAADFIQIYERKSGLFEKDGNIKKGYEHFYNTKAAYYELANNLDSAEYYYRKLVTYKFDYDAYNGLLHVFEKREIHDSIIKYSKLKEKAFDEYYTDLHTQAMFNADGMYNYARNQRLALEQKLMSEKKEKDIIIIMVICIIVFASMSCLLVKYRNKKKEEILVIKHLFNEISQERDKAKNDYELMTENFYMYKKMKAQEIAKKEEDLVALSSKMENYYKEDIVADICGSNIVKTLRDKENIKNPGYNVKISEEEWNELFSEFRHQMPNFYSTIIMNQKLSEQERKVVALMMSNFSAKSISILLNTSYSNVSNAKTSINMKLFDDGSAKTLYANLCSN